MKIGKVILAHLLPLFAKSQSTIELCKDDSMITLYVNPKEFYDTRWITQGKVVDQSDSHITLLLNEEGTYNIQAYFDNNTCKSDIANYQVKVIACGDNYFYVPNSFTPNGDGKNETFKPYGLMLNYDMEIYNRWGEMIYKGKEWSGDNIMAGVYVWKIINHNTNKIHIGRVTVFD